jgi:hypothetical protein
VKSGDVVVQPAIHGILSEQISAWVLWFPFTRWSTEERHFTSFRLTWKLKMLKLLATSWGSPQD